MPLDSVLCTLASTGCRFDFGKSRSSRQSVNSRRPTGRLPTSLRRNWRIGSLIGTFGNFCLGRLSLILLLRDQPVGNVIFVDVADVSDRLAANPF